MRGNERRGGTPARHLFQAVIAFSAWFGLAVQFDATWSANGSVPAALWIILRFFTILTALAAALVFTALALRPRIAPPALLGGLTLNILLVAIVYRLLLAGTLVQTGQEKLADLFLHSITPALVLLFWLLGVPRGALRPRHVWLWAAVPLLYFAYALARGAADGIYPYPFLDVAAIGWPAVLRNAALIAAGFLAAGFGLVGVDRRLARRAPD
jgi:hypothetical protein